jgi:hypothetical protein
MLWGAAPWTFKQKTGAITFTANVQPRPRRRTCTPSTPCTTRRAARCAASATRAGSSTTTTRCCCRCSGSPEAYTLVNGQVLVGPIGDGSAGQIVYQMTKPALAADADPTGLPDGFDLALVFGARATGYALNNAQAFAGEYEQMFDAQVAALANDWLDVVLETGGQSGAYRPGARRWPGVRVSAWRAQPAPPVEIGEITNFSGGANLRDAPSELAPNEAYGSYNCTFDERGGVASRLGYQKRNVTPIAAAKVINDFYSHMLGVTITQVGASLYRADSTSAAKTFTTSGCVTFTEFNNARRRVSPGRRALDEPRRDDVDEDRGGERADDEHALRRRRGRAGCGSAWPTGRCIGRTPGRSRRGRRRTSTRSGRSTRTRSSR